ncbi:MAG: hypothetical protein ACR2RF_26050 [Geminicoccaceae bacterium]
MTSVSFAKGIASHFINVVDELADFFVSGAYTDGTREEYTTATDVTGSGFADMMFGNDDDNTMRGGDGDDVIEGFFGNDQLFGGAGDDTFCFSYDDGKDEVTLGDGEDTIFFGDFYADQLILENIEDGGLKISIIGEDQEITVNDFFDEDSGNDNRLVVRETSTGELAEFSEAHLAGASFRQSQLLDITGGMPEDATSTVDLFDKAAELEPEAVQAAIAEGSLGDSFYNGGLYISPGVLIGGEFDPINDFEPEVA